VLGILGLDEQTERVYRELVQLGPCTVEALALRLGLERTPVAESVASLEIKSLAARDAGGLVHTAPPQLALGALLTAQRHALGQAELTAAALAEAYHAASAQNAHDLVQVVIGAEQVRQRLEHIQHNAETELLAFVQARIEVPESCESEAENSAVQRGVRYRVVLERAMLEGPQSVEPEAAEELRVVESLPTKLIIADRSTVMLPLSVPAAAASPERDGYAEDGPMVLISRAPGLVAAMVGLFESIWQRALPVRPAGDEAAEPEQQLPTPLDLRILSLLLVGATDAAIAKQLGLGLRTVQRRVAHMMELAEVSTRLQLGWQAHDRGWLKQG
jgi:sugar-specific transcriptional regulator TrmB/DNA-binding CsgD family transcriptional regulator